MHLGSNIHLSPLDGKPLCSFSKKLCRQRRLNGFGFCIRHILEDKEAPFKQCLFKTKSGDICINAVPIDAARSYCINHMHVMGLLPKLPKKGAGNKAVIKSASPSKKSKRKPVSNKTNKKAINKRTKSLISSHKDILSTKHHLDCESYSKSLQVRKLKYEMWMSDNKHSKAIKELISCDKTLVKRNLGRSKTSYRIGSENESDESEDNLPTIRNSLSSSQPSNLLAKLNQQYTHLRKTVKLKIKEDRVSYCVLSKLVAAAKESAAGTANVLAGTALDLFHSQEEKTKVCVTCCMIDGTTKCAGVTIPYTRYCRKHINEDSDQLLFVPSSFSTGNNIGFKPQSTQRQQQHHPCTVGNLDLRIFRPDIPFKLNKQSNNAPSVIARKRNFLLNKPVTHSNKRRKLTAAGAAVTSNKRSKTNETKKRKQPNKGFSAAREETYTDNNKNVKKPRKKKSSSTAASSNKGHNREEERSTGIYFPTPLSIEETPSQATGIGTELSTSGSESESSSSYTESSSSSESASSNDSNTDSDSDILTPEGTFQLPPGSLSLYPHVVAGSKSRLNDDDDDTGGMRGLDHRACGGLLPDEEDVELMRCSGGGASSSNFTMADMDRMMMMDGDRRRRDPSRGRGEGESDDRMLLSRDLSSPTDLMMSHHHFSDEFDQTLFGACSAAVLSPTGETTSSCAAGAAGPGDSVVLLTTNISIFTSPLKLCPSSSSLSLSEQELLDTSTPSSMKTIPSMTYKSCKDNPQPSKINIISASQSIISGCSPSNLTGGGRDSSATTLKITPVRPAPARTLSQENVNKQQRSHVQRPPLLVTSAKCKPPLISGTSPSSFSPSRLSSVIAPLTKRTPSYSDNAVLIANSSSSLLSNKDQPFVSSPSLPPYLNNFPSSSNAAITENSRNIYSKDHHFSSASANAAIITNGDGNMSSQGDSFASAASRSLNNLRYPHQIADNISQRSAANVEILNDVPAMTLDDGGVETPLEKVNPDIFFSSAFPVTMNPSDSL